MAVPGSVRGHSAALVVKLPLGKEHIFAEDLDADAQLIYLLVPDLTQHISQRLERLVQYLGEV
jgi:hypothetical protein